LPPADLFVGLMSGTSLDGVDAAVARFPDGRFEVLGSAGIAMPVALRTELLALQCAGHDELGRSMLAANALADLYAEAAARAMREAGVAAAAVAAIGCHGQTVRHRPDLGYTVQLNNPARLAERTGIDVVADFRSRDVAAGGQGAPLVPAFHRFAFADPARHRVVVNVGGIANLTDLAPGRPVRGWDTGPGNVLLDLWCARHLGEPFDRDGRFAAAGEVRPQLLAAMLAEPYFADAPPKSTGRDLFNDRWLGRFDLERLAPEDVQATLAALTCASVAGSIAAQCAGAAEVLVCGGGARNPVLMRLLAERLAPRRVDTTDAAGLPSGLVEAVAFAWLASRTLARQPGNLAEVTGARGGRILGAVWPG
jgi:anhydro-N-acetylmuramic acid kinase